MLRPLVLPTYLVTKFNCVLIFLLLSFSSTAMAAPSITKLSPTSGPVGTLVTVTGKNFGSTQGTSTVKFNGTLGVPTSWSATSIKVPVPTGATTGNVVVNVAGVDSNAAAFTVSPVITALSPNSGAVTAVIAINGTNFGATKGSSTVKFNTTTATPTIWGANSIQVPVPAGATSGNVVVTVSGVASNGMAFTVAPAPVISSLSRNSGTVGTSVTISGNNFGSVQGSSTVKFNGTAASATAWTWNSIQITVPSGATTGNVVVHASGVDSNGVPFTVPTLTSISVTPPSPSIALGLSQQLTATGTYSDSSTLDLTNAVNWASANPAIATVNSRGSTSSVSAGSTTVTATSGTVAGNTMVSVTPPALLSAIVTPQNPIIASGAVQQFTVTGTYSDGTKQNATASATWQSSNPSVATIGAGGSATGGAAGTTTITAQVSGLKAWTSLNVSAPGPPTIAAAVSPAPNAASWNNTDVTITFTCAPGSASIVSCTDPITLSTEGGNQVLSGTVTDASGGSATATKTLNLDKTPPALTVTSPVDGATLTNQTLSVTGTLSDTLSGLSSLTCNGTATTVSGTDFSCNISLVPGVNLVVVQATDAAGNVALSKMHVTYLGALPTPTSLSVTPTTANLVVGELRSFSAIDEQGRVRTNATWTVSNSSLATITSGSSPTLTAIAAGQVTLTATVQGISAQIPVTILAGALTPGTVSWSVPPPGAGFYPARVIQAVPVDGDGPALYSVAQNTQNSTVVRALTAHGQQVWQRTIAYPFWWTAPDGQGG